MDRRVEHRRLAAMARFGQPEVFNTDQGVQFTSAALLEGRPARSAKFRTDAA